MRRYPSNIPWLLASFAIVAITSASCLPQTPPAATRQPTRPSADSPPAPADAGKAAPTMWFADSTDPRVVPSYEPNHRRLLSRFPP